MEILVVICLGLLTGSAQAQIIRNVNVLPMSTTEGTAKFSTMLRCDIDTSVYVASIAYIYNPSTCICSTQQSRCPVNVEPAGLDVVSTNCWTSQECNVNFPVSPFFNCNVQANIIYVCAPENPSLTINNEFTTTGQSLTASYSTSRGTVSRESAQWWCQVEASDCSRIIVSLVLVIRNANDTASVFLVPGASRGVKGVAWGYATFRTPFDVVLNVVPNTGLLNAYFAVQANTSMTVTCGRRPTPVPTSSNNVSIVSTPPSSISGHELTAVHSSSGEERAGDWSCVVETADCSTATPVQVAFYVRSRPCRGPSYFSVNGSQEESGSTVTVTAPIDVTLHLVQGSVVNLAYFSVKAQQNLFLVCGRHAGFPPQPVGSQCAACQSNPCPANAKCVPSPGSFQCVCRDGFSVSSDGLSCLDVDECTRVPSSCDVSAHCNSTEGSFHCYCDPGFSLTDNGTGCTDINECTRDPPPCNLTAHCNNTEGSFHCYCDPGFSLTDNGTGCQDINECDVEPSVCDLTAHCNNTEGSFHCYCDAGFSLTDNGRGCLGPLMTASQPQTSVVGPAVGGGVGGVVVIAVVVVIIIVVVLRSSNRKKTTESEVSLESDHSVYVNNAYEDPSQREDSHIMVNYETPMTRPEDQQYINTTSPAGPVTSEDSTDYDALGLTRPGADAKSNATYGHLQHNGSQQDDVEYSYDRAGGNPRRKVITGANYETPTFVGAKDEGKDDVVQYGYSSAAKTAGPGVITDAVYHVLQPVSSADEPVQDIGGDLETQATSAPRQPGAVAVDLEDGPIYTNSEVTEGGKDQRK